jgi:hypothetical protein
MLPDLEGVGRIAWHNVIRCAYNVSPVAVAVASNASPYTIAFCHVCSLHSQHTGVVGALRDRDKLKALRRVAGVAIAKTSALRALSLVANRLIQNCLHRGAHQCRILLGQRYMELVQM